MKMLSRREFAQATITVLGGVGLTPVPRMPIGLFTEPPSCRFPSNAIPAERVGRDARWARTALVAEPRCHNKKLRIPG